ncbi:hypothetical protein [Sphingosinicella sp.]|uniref:hypothetical protein n=1 Tax=Sphingosinicella sp. TaxID=1917971 RepID=UPI001845698D|nr:hypothetical protein [Sphingosinicella sp.]MBA4757327.1 hypothetical protein [Sphingosinicella sp.]
MKLRVQALTALVISAAFIITPSPVSQGQASSASQRYHADKGLYSMARDEVDLERVDDEALKAVETLLLD